MVATKLNTVDDLLALGSDARYELLGGELVEMSPSYTDHSRIALFIGGQLDAYSRRTRRGFTTQSDGGYLIARDPDSILAPDAAFVRRERIPAGHDFRSFFPGAPDIAVEVVSPSETASDVARKLSEYRRAGVPLVWVVSPKQRTISVYRLGQPPVTLQESDTITGEDVLPGFSMSVAEVFADPLADEPSAPVPAGE
jgi:Uma2 family endonuclease